MKNIKYIKSVRQPHQMYTRPEPILNLHPNPEFVIPGTLDLLIHRLQYKLLGHRSRQMVVDSDDW